MPLSTWKRLRLWAVRRDMRESQALAAALHAYLPKLSITEDRPAALPVVAGSEQV
jgi:hypothetical protein